MRKCETRNLPLFSGDGKSNADSESKTATDR